MDKITERNNIVNDEEDQGDHGFLINISHEIRTPLNAIIGYAHLLHKNAQTTSQLDRSRRLLQTADYLQTLINNYLDLAKLNAGETRLKIKSFEPSQVIAQVCKMLAGLADARALRLIFHTSDLPAAIDGDETCLSQILINIIGNAIKFTETGSISVSGKTIRKYQDRVVLRFEVTDSGIGITPAELNGLFRQYRQANIEIQQDYNGTGLGLAISKHLVNLMNGTIGVKSTPGQGSTFWFEIPFILSAEAIRCDNGEETQSAVELADLLRSRAVTRILLVEDNIVNQEIIFQFLSFPGLKVHTASNGRSALNMLSVCGYDLVLMDLCMPLMDGMQASREIRSISHCAQIPIIAMTACDFKTDSKAPLPVCINDYLIKPVTPDDLYRVLIRWLGNKQKHDPTKVAGNKQDSLVAAFDICGLDIQTGLKYLQNDQELYRKLLLRFSEIHSADGEKMNLLLAMGEYKAICRLAHKMKGAGSSLGLVRIQTLTDRIEALAYRLNDSNAETSERLQLQTLISELAKHLYSLAADLQKLSLTALETEVKKIKKRNE